VVGCVLLSQKYGEPFNHPPAALRAPAYRIILLSLFANTQYAVAGSPQGGVCQAYMPVLPADI
jgi:hypothetical protein